ncbi:tetratricopeptide repeat protein [candidate division CSSED10-310 bacterium]|uniref:Tetratricopeptide repeat protein n=1 Tax=candidate division CSSED10-310 bacterium TaxID=2855610 RepID=A0ABV6Z0W1_UNCC1
MATNQKTIGPYYLIKLLGEGGMGIVYKGQHRSTGAEVAIKTLRIIDDSLFTSIRREIRVLSRIKHPGIVRIVDEGLHEGLPWYAMELLLGVTLRNYFKRGTNARAQTTISPSERQEQYSSTHAQIAGLGNFKSTADNLSEEEMMRDWWTQSLNSHEIIKSGPPNDRLLAEETTQIQSPRRAVGEIPEILTMVRCLCSPLAFLHGEGIVHRDLKPDNIIVTDNGLPIVVDFGIMTQFTSEESREMLFIESISGSIRYMAPEQIKGEFVDARADLYSLGCIMYELLVGRPPFNSPTRAEIIRGHLQRNPPPPSKFRAEIPTALDNLVLQLLAKNPHHRLGHPDAVAAVLSRLGGDDGVTLKGPPPKTFLYRSRFTGRDLPMSQLEEQKERMINGHGGLIFVGGESGVGKTRLVMEFGREVAHLNVMVLTGNCSKLTSRAFDVFRNTLQTIADRCRSQGRDETETLLGKRGKVLSMYEESFACLPGQDAYPDPIELPIEAAKIRLFSCFWETLNQLAQREKIVLILDDMQWADGLTYGFLEFILRTGQLAQSPLLFVCTYRSDEMVDELQNLLHTDSVMKILLARLDEESVSTIVGDMLSLHPAPRLFSRHLSHHSEGNPLFVAEYLRVAVEEQLLFRDDCGNWQIDITPDQTAENEQKYESLPIPRSLHGLISSRLQKLSGSAKKVMKAASMVGREVDIRLIYEITNLDQKTMFDVLEELAKKHILVIVTGKRKESRITFTHAKIREVVLHGLPGDERKTFHRTIAESIETLYVQNLAHYFEDLGWHWAETGEQDKAKQYYLNGAQIACEQYDLTAAEKMYRSYLRLMEHPTGESISVRNALGRKVLWPLGRTEEAIGEHKRALEEAVNMSHKEYTVLSQGYVGFMLWRIGRKDEARVHLEKSLSLSREMGNRREEGSALCYLATLYVEQGQPEWGGKLYEQSIQCAREANDHLGEAQALGNFALLHFYQGRKDQAFPMLEDVLSIARRLGDQPTEARALGNMAILYFERGDLDQAESIYHKVINLHKSMGNIYDEGRGWSNLALLIEEKGRYREALNLFREALAIHRQVGDRHMIADTLMNLSNLHSSLGNFSSARETCQESLALHQELKNQRGLGMTSVIQTKITRRSGDYEAAEHSIIKAECILKKLGDEWSLGRCYCQWGHLALAKNEHAQPYLEKSQHCAQVINSPSESILGNDIECLERAFQLFQEGQTLIHGEAISDIPDELVKLFIKEKKLPPGP